MSILINGMKMPENCWKCNFAEGEICLVDMNDHGDYDHPDNCPLIELPPHGNLIDTDALMKSLHDEFDDDEVKAFEKGAYWNHSVVVDIITNAPTIIEAEGRE